MYLLVARKLFFDRSRRGVVAHLKPMGPEFDPQAQSVCQMRRFKPEPLSVEPSVDPEHKTTKPINLPGSVQVTAKERPKISSALRSCKAQCIGESFHD